ncbi:hypothetical protein [Marinilabilia sp.]|nr:hypothetical protein [Marinilabilia sp.]
MPVAGDYGFIFNFGEDYRKNYEILAHELAHVRVHLASVRYAAEG